ncbi:MAG: YwbE family protein [Bacillota bacterium]
MDGQERKSITPGIRVAVVKKENQRNGHLSEGTVDALLTKSQFHPHGIKVRLEDGNVGRVKKILD